MSITEIISYQSTEGGWKDIDLIGVLFNKDLQEKVSELKDMTIVVTYLVSKWIEKMHPEAQYKLVIKKGLNYVKKCVFNY